MLAACRIALNPSSPSTEKRLFSLGSQDVVVVYGAEAARLAFTSRLIRLSSHQKGSMRTGQLPVLLIRTLGPGPHLVSALEEGTQGFFSASWVLPSSTLR